MEGTAVRGRLIWQMATVVDTTWETPQTKRIRFALPDWPGHSAGQHVDVRLTAEDGYTAQRSYSIASPPEHSDLGYSHIGISEMGISEIELIVERLADGEVSPYLTDELRAADLVELRGPIGGYFVWPEHADAPVQLIAGGSGVVPFLSMLAHHRLSGGGTPVRLLYSVRSDAEVIGRPELAPRPDLNVTRTYTRAVPPGWTGPTGRVDLKLLAEHTVPVVQRPHVLVCGPTTFVEAVSRGLLRLGHDPSRIKTERYGGMGEST
jgi:ferredoxin-NADP reductase